jgi:hypothetical protein
MIITCKIRSLIDKEIEIIKEKWTTTTANTDKLRLKGDPPTTYRYDILGAQVEFDPVRRYLKIHCSKYIGKILEKFRKNGPDFRTANSPCDPGFPDISVGKDCDDFPIRELVGALGHLVQVCRPDIAF